MKLEEARFKSIIDGTATNLSSKELLIRRIIFDAERAGIDPRQAVETAMSDVIFVARSQSQRQSAGRTIPAEPRGLAEPARASSLPKRPKNQSPSNRATVNARGYTERTAAAFAIFVLCCGCIGWITIGPPAVIIVPFWVFIGVIFYKPFEAIWSDLMKGWLPITIWGGMALVYLLQLLRILPS